MKKQQDFFFQNITQVYVFILNYLYKIISIVIHLFKSNKKEETTKSIKDIANKYVDNYKDKFMNLLQILDKKEKNKNIESVFYCKTEYHNILQDINNQLEAQWKKRILFENTPRGNIIMHYDPYKLGFVYYSDQYIPYDILNAVAMKYTTIFNCIDFFVDEHIVSKDIYQSPIIKLLEEDKKEQNEEKNQTKNPEEKRDANQNAPFVKFKNYNKVSSKVAENKINNSKLNNNTNINENNTNEKPKQRNRFIYMGKMMNFSFLQIPPKKNILFKSELLEGLKKNTSVQKEVFNYKDFKKRFIESEKM